MVISLLKSLLAQSENTSFVSQSCGLVHKDHDFFEMAKRKISENAVPATPEYRLRRKKGEEKGSVRFLGGDGKWVEKIFPGDYDSGESVRAYQEFCEVWIRTNGSPVAPAVPDEATITIQDIAERFFTHLMETHNNPRSIHSYKSAIQNLFDAGYRLMRGIDFDVKALKAFQTWLAARYERKLANRRVTKTRMMIQYACEEGLLPPSQYHALLCIGMLPKFSTPRETPPVKAAPDADIQAIIPYLNPIIKILVIVHRYCGASPGEILRLNTKEMNMTGDRERPVANSCYRMVANGSFGRSLRSQPSLIRYSRNTRPCGKCVFNPQDIERRRRWVDMPRWKQRQSTLIEQTGRQKKW